MKWSAVLGIFLYLCFTCACVRGCCDLYACWELNSESRLLSGAKMFLHMALPARNPQERHGCRYSSGNVSDRLYIYREGQVERSDSQCKVERGRSNGWEG